MEIYVAKKVGYVVVPYMRKNESTKTLEKIYDREDLIRFFGDELLGHTKYMLSDYDRKIYEKNKLFGMSTTDKARKDIQEQIKKIKLEKENKVSRFKNIKVKIGIIVELCSRYGLNLDGTLRKDSKYKEIFDILNENSDKKTKNDFWKLFASIQKQIISEYKNLTNLLQDLGITDFDIYFINSSNEYNKFSYGLLLDTTAKYPRPILDSVIEKCVEEKQQLNANIQQNNDEDIEIGTNQLLLEKTEKIEYLQSSKKLKPNELELLNKVEFTLRQTISLGDGIKKIKKALLFLQRHSNFKSIIQQLKKQLKQMSDEYLKLEHLSNELYKKYDIEQQIILVNEMIENNKIQGETIYSMDNSGDDTRKWSTNKEVLDQAKSSERILKGRTLMAQYLREKAFKTKDGKLTWREFAEKYSKIYDVDSITITRLNQEIGEKSERKL